MGFAGGNFYFVENMGDEHGHNVFEDNPDDVLTTAPSPGTYCGQETSCHTTLSAPYGAPGSPHRQGCSKCHMLDGMHAPYPDPVHSKPLGYHHKDDSDLLTDSMDEGWYRFMSGHQSGLGRGVTGIEDDDWQYTVSATDHNEYMAPEYGLRERYRGGMFTADNTITGFCTGCHKDFHITVPLGPPYKRFRHPVSDTAIPNRDEYVNAFGAAGSGVGTYDPRVPVARPLASLSGVSGDVNIGQDKVMCLSCHKAHGSPYSDMLRFDYEAIIAGGGTSTGGCFKCHTQKDDGS